jgi:hypothetical protein
MKKDFIIFQDRTAFDLRGNKHVVFPPGSCLNVFGISRSLRAMVFGSGSDTGLAVLFDNKQTKTIHGNSIIPCGAVVAGEFILVGDVNCIISVYRLPELTLVSSSTAHSAEVVTVAGCLDLGLIASVNSENNLVVETFFDHKFINFVSLPRASHRPVLAVFKSGTVCAGQDGRLMFFDCRAMLLMEVERQNLVVQIEKYYDVGHRELLIVALENGRIEVFDVTTFDSLYSIETNIQTPKICPIKGARTFVAVVGQNEGGATLESIYFGATITTQFAGDVTLDP